MRASAPTMATDEPSDPASADARLEEIATASRRHLHMVQNLLGVPTILVGVLEAETLSEDTRLLAADAQVALEQIVVEVRALQAIMCSVR